MMLRDKAIRNKLLVVLGFIIMVQASAIGWSLMSSPVAISEAKLPQDFQALATQGMGEAAIQALCDTARGNVAYVGLTGGSIHLFVVENGCPKGGQS